MTRSLLLAVAAAGLTLAACDSTVDPVDDGVDLTVRADSNVAADPTTGRNPTTGAPISSGRFALYSLRDSSLVLASSETDRSDSTSTAWDIGFRGTDIIVNGGTSGPGNGGAVVLTGTPGTLFDELTAVPTGTEFRVDGTATCSNGTSFAICGGSGNGWYTYTPFTTGGGYITPTAGRTILVRTADGEGYAKVQILSYYQGAPDPSTITVQSVARYYTFRYVVNPEGTTFVETAD